MDKREVLQKIVELIKEHDDGGLLLMSSVGGEAPIQDIVYDPFSLEPSVILFEGTEQGPRARFEIKVIDKAEKQ